MDNLDQELLDAARAVLESKPTLETLEEGKRNVYFVPIPSGLSSESKKFRNLYTHVRTDEKTDSGFTLDVLNLKAQETVVPKTSKIAATHRKLLELEKKGYDSKDPDERDAIFEEMHKNARAFGNAVLEARNVCQADVDALQEKVNAEMAKIAAKLAKEIDRRI